jgi:hypothetical protein
MNFSPYIMFLQEWVKANVQQSSNEVTVVTGVVPNTNEDPRCAEGTGSVEEMSIMTERLQSVASNMLSIKQLLQMHSSRNNCGQRINAEVDSLLQACLQEANSIESILHNAR